MYLARFRSSSSSLFAGMSLSLARLKHQQHILALLGHRERLCEVFATWKWEAAEGARRELGFLARAGRRGYETRTRIRS